MGAFQEYLSEQRKVKQERYQEEQKSRQAEYKITQMQKKVDALDEQPFVSEITLIEQTIKFCKTLVGEKSEEKKVEAKETVFNNKEGEEVLLTKASRNEEMYYVATKKGKAAKKTKAEGDVSKKPIKHNAETFKLFDSLKLDAPITTADIPALLIKLAEQKAGFEVKVKEWENEREALKAKILAGAVDDEEEKKEEPKEEEKEAEKEAEKEEE